MSKQKVYLAGPINGCTDSECNDWRSRAKDILHQIGYETLDPMDRDYRGVEDSSWNSIVEGDKKDIQDCDFILAYCPSPSVGTSMEIFYAWTIGKRVIAVVPQGKPVSPWLRYHAMWVLGTVEQALEWFGNHYIASAPVCKKHPKYKAKRRPVSCRTCMGIWMAKQLKEELA